VPDRAEALPANRVLLGCAAGTSSVAGTNRSELELTEILRRILTERGRLNVPVSQIEDDADLYLAGLTSQSSAAVMLALEDTFELEFPERMMRREVFESIAAMRGAVTEILGEAVAASPS
jgi:acyl carrier protein